MSDFSPDCVLIVQADAADYSAALVDCHGLTLPVPFTHDRCSIRTSSSAKGVTGTWGATASPRGSQTG